MISPCRVRNSSGPDGSGQSRTSSRPPGSQGAHAAAQDARRVVELVERVLEVGEVVFADLARIGGLGLTDLDAVGQALFGHRGARPGD